MDWSVVAIVAIVIWGGVKAFQAKYGIVSDEDGNETRLASPDAYDDTATKAEVKALKERVAVLERVVTDPSNNLAQEIESLRDSRSTGSGIPLDIDTKTKA
jgi:hypothetical protein